jgi:hypothetical protein
MAAFFSACMVKITSEMALPGATFSLVNQAKFCILAMHLSEMSAGCVCLQKNKVPTASAVALVKVPARDCLRWLFLDSMSAFFSCYTGVQERQTALLWEDRFSFKKMSNLMVLTTNDRQPSRRRRNPARAQVTYTETDLLVGSQNDCALIWDLQNVICKTTSAKHQWTKACITSRSWASTSTTI